MFFRVYDSRPSLVAVATEVFVRFAMASRHAAEQKDPAVIPTGDERQATSGRRARARRPVTTKEK